MLVRVDGGLVAVEHLVHVGVLPDERVEEGVVAAAVHVAHDRGEVHQGVVGVLEGRDQHQTLPLALQEAGVHAEHLFKENSRNSTRAGVWGAGRGVGLLFFCTSCRRMQRT